MLSANEVKRGMVLRLDGKLLQVVEFQHQKIGRGGASLILKLKDLGTGSTFDRTYTATKRYERVQLMSRHVQYLYNDSAGRHFMDMESFEELTLSDELLGGQARFLVDGVEIDVLVEGERPVSVALPTSVVMKVTEAAPGHRGDTASSATKPATVESGLVVLVPLFVEAGANIRVDTRTGQYIERM